MQISYNFTDEDKKKFLSCNFQNQNKKYKIFSYLFFLIAILVFIITIISQDFKNAFIFLVLAILIYYAYFLLPKITRKKHLKKLEQSGVLKEKKTISLEETQIRISSPSRTITYQYSNVRKVSILNDYFILITFKHEDSFIIPSSAFSSSEHKIDFINKIKTNAKVL